MLGFNQSIPDDAANRWRYELDSFVSEYQEELAALMWGLLSEWNAGNNEILGIDLKPHPHFICCTRTALEKFNRRVDRKVQEIIGIVSRYDPKEEVAIVAIGYGQVKLIYFKPDTPPPECFDRSSPDLDALILSLEAKMADYIQPLPV